MIYGWGMILEFYYLGYKFEKIKNKLIFIGNYGLVWFYLEIINRVICYIFFVFDFVRFRSFEKNGSFKDVEIFNFDDFFE